MKTTEVREIKLCDECGEEATKSCLGCGLDHCYNHRQELGVTYQYAVRGQGYEDGYYCHECDERLKNCGDPLHAAYLQIQALRKEHKDFHVVYDGKVAEADLRLKAMWHKFSGDRWANLKIFKTHPRTY